MNPQVLTAARGCCKSRIPLDSGTQQDTGQPLLSGHRSRSQACRAWDLLTLGEKRGNSVYVTFPEQEDLCLGGREQGGFSINTLLFLLLPRGHRTVGNQFII